MKIYPAIVSCALIISVLHYFITAMFRPRRFLKLIDQETTPAIRWPYIGAVVIGSCAIVFPGFESILSWAPLSWGWTNEEGSHYLPARRFVAVLLTVLALSLLEFMANSARRFVAIELLREEVFQLEQELARTKRELAAQP
jgi:hypothetical protein